MTRGRDWDESGRDWDDPVDEPAGARSEGVDDGEAPGCRYALVLLLELLWTLKDILLLGLGTLIVWWLMGLASAAVALLFGLVSYALGIFLVLNFYQSRGYVIRADTNSDGESELVVENLREVHQFRTLEQLVARIVGPEFEPEDVDRSTSAPKRSSRRPKRRRK